MQIIKIHVPLTGAYYNEKTYVIDLLELNREREQLPDGQKITLYVDGDIYLQTKWAMKEIDFGLVRVKREE